MTLLDARWVGVSSPWPNSAAFGPNRPFGSIDIRLASALQRAMHSAMPLHGSFLGEKITLTRWLGSLCSALSGVVLFTNPGSAGVLDASWTSPTTNTDGSALTALGSYRVYYVASDTSPCPGFAFLEVASPTTIPDGRTVSVTLTGLTTDMFYTVAVTAVDLGGNESACSTSAGAVARDDGSTVSSSDPGAVSSSDSGAVISSDGVAVDSGDGVAVNPAGTVDGGAVDGGADISSPATDTGDRVWR
jgi:hypothetical protein